MRRVSWRGGHLERDKTDIYKTSSSMVLDGRMLECLTAVLELFQDILPQPSNSHPTLHIHNTVWLNTYHLGFFLDVSTAPRRSLVNRCMVPSRFSDCPQYANPSWDVHIPNIFVKTLHVLFSLFPNIFPYSFLALTPKGLTDLPYTTKVSNPDELLSFNPQPLFQQISL